MMGISSFSEILKSREVYCLSTLWLIHQHHMCSTSYTWVRYLMHFHTYMMASWKRAVGIERVALRRRSLFINWELSSNPSQDRSTKCMLVSQCVCTWIVTGHWIAKIGRTIVANFKNNEEKILFVSSSGREWRNYLENNLFLPPD